MKTQTRKAVSPIIATLLLIAITVAAGVVVYVFVGGLSANLSKSGGNQVTEQISLDAYTTDLTTTSANTITLTLRNTGAASVTISAVYINGQALTAENAATVTIAAGSGSPNPLTIGLDEATGTAANHYSWNGLTFSGSSDLTSGLSYQVKVVTLDGAVFSFNIIAGSSG